MSTCNETESATNCPCDTLVHPAHLEIPAGQVELARQIAAFPEFRRVMLLAASEYAPLSSWAATKEQDLGVMLIEMWAYVCDSLAFYDSVIAHENYLRTARLRPSVRKLVEMLGYVPRPATAATVQLAALASGRQSVSLPQGTAFRSIAFDGQPPQVFELDETTAIHPFINQWEVRSSLMAAIRQKYPSTLVVNLLGDLPIDTIVWVRHTNLSKPKSSKPGVIQEIDYTVSIIVLQDSVNKVTAKNKFTANDGKVYTELQLSPATKLLPSSATSFVNLFRFKERARVYMRGVPAKVDMTKYDVEIFLDKVYENLKGKTSVVIEIGSKRLVVFMTWAVITAVSPVNDNAIEINGNTFALPKNKENVSHFKVSKNKELADIFNKPINIAEINIYFHQEEIARVVNLPDKALAPTTKVYLKTSIEEPNESLTPKQFILEDKNHLGVALEGNLEKPSNLIKAPDVSHWTLPLYHPVKAYGNIVTATRGESVHNEIMGSGNASVANQAFKLKKKPLTYVLSPTAGNDQGVASTLVIHVDGIQWREVPNFYLAGPDDQVFMVRQNDTQESTVTFGDGLRGSRLPTGHNNVVAHYRFGAGAATPPAGGINQIGKPVKGLQSVVNPVAASPGADAEDQENIRNNAPNSILIMGRSVSIKDMEAVAQTVPGVRVAQVEWRWSMQALCPTVHVWYIGAASLKKDIEARLQSISDPNTLFTVEVAKEITMDMQIDVAHDLRYDPKELKKAIFLALAQEKVGFLTPENLGIGQPLFRSQLWAAILAVPGCEYVNYICLGKHGGAFDQFSKYAMPQLAGHYWNFEGRLLSITFNQPML